MTAYHDYEIRQIDVKTAFLNGNFLANVYMTQGEALLSRTRSRFVSFKRLFMYSSNLLRTRTSILMKQSKSLVFEKMNTSLAYTRK